MKKVVINGINLSLMSHITGIQRYAREIIIRLDDFLSKKGIQVEYAYFHNATNTILKPEELRYIHPIPIKAFNSRMANLFTLPRYIKKEGAVGVNFSPEILNSKAQIACVHDLRPVLFRSYDSWHFRLSFWATLHIVKKTASKIVTVSDYQKKEICKYFKIKDTNKVVTIYNGWEHMRSINVDEAIFSKFPQLKDNDYYYTLGSLAPHKNLQWVIEVAKRNPKQFFAIAGGKNLKNWRDSIEKDSIPNVLFLGYVSDSENKALMKHCKAFLHPSKYEGFGIPPLEALACGAQIAVSNATCLPEIYEDAAHYFDPNDYDINIDKLISQPVASPNKILQKCSWDKSSSEWMKLILSIL